MYIKYLLLFFFTMSFAPLQAQKNKAEIDSLNALLSQCIQKNVPDSEVLDDSFLLYDWAKSFQEYCGEVLYKNNNKVLTEIADQHEVVLALIALKDRCEMIQNFEKELDKINKVFNKKLSDQSKEKTNSKLSFQESRVVEFTVSDTRKLKAYVNSIVNRLEGDNSIFRIFR